MATQKPPEYGLELSADRSNVKDVVEGILHTIFFHRCFNPIEPASHDVLELTLPYVSQDDIETLIEQRTTTFLRSLDAASTTSSPQSQMRPSRGQLVVQFLEKKRRKGWFVAKADEETVWENWVVDITLTTARSEPEAARNRKQMEKQLQTAAMAVIETANREKSHIPPITSTDSNPFPYQILVNPKSEAWSQR